MSRYFTTGTLSHPRARLARRQFFPGTRLLLQVLVLLCLCGHASAARILMEDPVTVKESSMASNMWSSIVGYLKQSVRAGTFDTTEKQMQSTETQAATTTGKPKQSRGAEKNMKTKKAPVDLSNEEDFPSLDSVDKATSDNAKQAVKKWDADEVQKRIQKYLKRASPTKPASPTQTVKRCSITIMTWNARDVVDAELTDVKEHAKYIRDALVSLVKANQPSVLVLQEVQACKLIDGGLPDFTCVDSTIDAKAEAVLPRLALGNVVLYETKLFDASNANRLMQGLPKKNSQPYKVAAQHKHGGRKKNPSLYGFHKTECTWKGYNGCRTIWPDAPRVTTVRLKPNCAAGFWSQAVCNEFKHGLRIAAVHLFAGGKWIQKKVLNSEQVLQRRRFQMRALFHLVDHWNYEDSQFGEEPPTSVYVGDFNTPKASELLDVLGAANDYGVDLWCPMLKGYCKQLASGSLPTELKSHPKGHLDHVVMDMRLQSQSFPMATSKIIAQPSMLDERGRQKYPGCKSAKVCQSDHSPMLVDLQVVTK